MSLDENFHHAAKQANIALGLAITAAASLEIDTTPMEGFDAPALDEFVNLHAKGLRSSMLLAVGYRDTENDWNLKNEKVRKPMEEFVTFYNHQFKSIKINQNEKYHKGKNVQ